MQASIDSGGYIRGRVSNKTNTSLNHTQVSRLRPNRSHLVLCFLPETSVTQHVFLTLSPPSLGDRVTFPFLPHTVLFRSVHLCLFTSLPASPSIWRDEHRPQLLLSCRRPVPGRNESRHCRMHAPRIQEIRTRVSVRGGARSGGGTC